METQPETELERAKRHVRQGEKHVAQQLTLLDQLQQDGLPTQDAADFLKVLEETLASERDHLALIEREIREERQAGSDQR